MVNINIVCVGNLKEKYWAQACAEYAKRLSRFCKLNVIEVAEENKFEDIDKILSREGENILKKVSGEVVLLAIEGQAMSSENLSSFIEKKMLVSGEITFIIGGSYGVSEEVKKIAKTQISFGKITLPHNLARVVLLEQLYRAFMISAGSAYHK